MAVINIAIGVVLGFMLVFLIFFTASLVLVVAGALAAILYIVDLMFALMVITRRKIGPV